VYKRVGFAEFSELKDWQDIYQIIRQYVYANLLADILREKPVVIPLINKDHSQALAQIYRKAQDSVLGKKNVLRDMVTWQAFLEAISHADLVCAAKLKKKMTEALEASKKYVKKAKEYY